MKYMWLFGLVLMGCRYNEFSNPTLDAAMKPYCKQGYHPIMTNHAVYVQKSLGVVLNGYTVDDSIMYATSAQFVCNK